MERLHDVKYIELKDNKAMWQCVECKLIDNSCDPHFWDNNKCKDSNNGCSINNITD